MEMHKTINKMFFLNMLPYFSLLCISMSALVFFISTYKEYLEVKTVSNELSYRLTEIFVDNENIAHAVSSKYYELLDEGCLTSSAKNETLGVVIYTGIKEADAKFKCMTSALDFINKKSASVVGTIYKERYFYSPDLNLLYFFSKNIPVDLDYKKFDAFYKNRVSKGKVPDYYERMLSKDVKKKGFSSTGIYNDFFTGEKSYTLMSYAFAIDKDKVLGYVYYNHSQSELKSNLISFMKLQPQPQPWISASIINRLNNKEICFYSDCKNRDINYQVDYSDLYKLVISINIFEYLKHNTATKIVWFVVILVCLILFFISIVLRSNDYIKSITDPLTKTFSRKILKHIAPSDNSGFVLFDVNKFKYINDNFGHHAGDKALTKIARLIEQCISKNDVLIRLGGDEYLAYIPSISKGELEILAEKITSVIESNPLEFKGDKINLSASYGIAMFDKSIENTLSLADHEMYKQKNA